jgi:hypothetical protein
VGDDSRSWAFDGVRSLAWHGGHSRSFGAQEAAQAGDSYWKAGDIVGVFVSLSPVESPIGSNEKRKSTAESRRLTISYSMNGKNFGKAFEEVVEDEEAMFVPAVSLEGGESVRINIGQRPFVWLPVSEAPRPVLDALDQTYYDALVGYMKFCSEFDQPSSVSGDSTTPVAGSADVNPPADNAAGPRVSQSFDPIDIEDAEFASPEAFERFGMAHLKVELERRGLKSGGTLKERAMRLYLVRGVPADKIDKKLRAKV